MKARRPGTLSVRQRFLRITIPLIFLSVMGVFTIIEAVAHRNATDELALSSELLMRTETASMVDPMWNLDGKQIQLRLEAIIANREVVAARVFGEDGQFVAEVRDPVPSKKVSETLKRDVVRHTEGGDGDGRVIGRLEVEITNAEIWAQTRDRLIWAGFVALLAVSMEVGAALFALRQIVGKPLARLMAAINAEKAGEHRQAINVETMDEMGQVITSFNEMIEQQDAYETELAQQARMESELGIGRDLQLAMVPRNFFEIAGDHPFSIWAELLPAREVGGDFYDAFFLDDHQLCICIGDVADKGVPAALYMAVAKTLTRAFAKGHDCPSSAVAKVNDELCEADNKGMFASLFFAVLDIRTGRLRYTNAGHNPPYLLGKGQKVHGLSARNGPVIGASAGVRFTCATVLLAPDDLLLLYTDGVTEAKAPDAGFFGEEKLRQLLMSQPDATAKDLARNVLRAVETHEANGDRTDDVTLLTLRYDGQSNPRWQGRYPAQLSALQDLFANLSDALSDQSEHIVSRARLLVDEVASNAVKHGHRSDKAPVSLQASVEVADSQTLLTLIDNAPAFDPDDAPEPDIAAGLEDRPVGGLGLLLVREISDAFRYVRDGDHNIYRILLCDPNPPFEAIQPAKAS